MKHAGMVNIFTKEIELIPKINTSRAFHAMTFINSLPAVIGGYSRSV